MSLENYNLDELAAVSPYQADAAGQPQLGAVPSILQGVVARGLSQSGSTTTVYSP
jgi:hypothetical protein